MISMRAWMIGAALVATLANTAYADQELKNDGFSSGGTAGFQGGFVSGEIGASRFVAPSAGLNLLKVQLLFGGGSTATQNVILHVWDDTSGAMAPGTELFIGTFSVMGSDSAMHELIMPGVTVVPQQFRIGIEFTHAGAPSIARDADNTIDAAKNYIFASGGLGWQRSQTFGLTGDWIIRAIVSGGAASPDGPPGGSDAGVGPGEDCSGNADCPAGQFCDTQQGSCTFECRVSEDCGEGTCNSLGQCVGSGGGGGCCQTDRGGEIGALLLGLLVFGLLLGRRRRCCD